MKSKRNEEVLVPDMGVGRCLGPEGNGGQLGGKGQGRAWPPQEAGKISSQCSARAGTTWARTRKTRQVRRDEEGSARTE